eukprot:CAMPEP_0116099714 /NCGR_PEP_ID=MMETSP0327-20121206/11914_1 /TAXON_ID=44447 /ORGANISM="Pseudo-nitzschia delicatissima, Strain B596" /LENGTH=339 /DNA_ID=CAMNT_0003591607 /DNA_START=204 /DNA_END=1223 /DNA_ORIENTATION=-
MVLLEAMCAMNLAANAMVNGVCCCYPESKDEKRLKEHEKVIQKSIRTELNLKLSDDDDDDKHFGAIANRDRSNDSGTTKSSTSNTRNGRKKNRIPRSSDDLVQAYKDALESRTEKQRKRHQRDEQRRLQRQQHEHFTPPHSRKLIATTGVSRDQPPASSAASRSSSNNNNNSNNNKLPRNKFPFGIPARSFSRVSTDKCDNRYKLDNDANNNDHDNDNNDDDEGYGQVFFYSSDESTAPTTTSPQHYQQTYNTHNTTTTPHSSKEQPSFVNEYNLRQRSSLLPPIRTVSSLLEERSADANSEYDHDWLDWDNSSPEDTEWQEWVHHDPSFASADISLAE